MVEAIDQEERTLTQERVVQRKQLKHKLMIQVEQDCQICAESGIDLKHEQYGRRDSNALTLIVRVCPCVKVVVR